MLIGNILMSKIEIETKYNYEKIWTLTSEKDLYKMIEDEIGGIAVEGTLQYLKECIQQEKELEIGTCKFRKKK